jgi:hypothetical protein
MIPFIFSFMRAYGETPFPPTSLGRRDRIVVQVLLVSIIAEDISALLCRPNTSVRSFIGSVLMYSRQVSKVGSSSTL